MAKASVRDHRRPHDSFSVVKDRACGLTRQTIDAKLSIGARSIVQRTPQYAAILSRLSPEFNHFD